MPSLFSRKKELSPAQIERFANIFDNAGQVFLAVMVLTPIIQGIDYSSILVIILGVLDTALCWGLSLILAKRKDKAQSALRADSSTFTPYSGAGPWRA